MNLLNPYAWGTVVLALTLAFFGGCHVQKGRDAGKIAAKDRALSVAAQQLRSAADAMRAVNREADRQIKEAKAQADAAEATNKVLTDEKRALAARNEQFDRQLAAAKAKKPDCAALAAMDFTKVCGVPIR